MPSLKQFSSYYTTFLTATILGLGVCYGYDRSDFKHWQDYDKDGLNTREEILASQALTYVVTKRKGKDVIITWGQWTCPYVGRTFNNPSDIDVDHIVPLKYAWDHGADEWDDVLREQFANDPMNLLAVWKGANRSKGASGPLKWMPPNFAYSQQYINKFIDVCEKYELDCPIDKIINLREFLKPHVNGFQVECLQGVE